MLDTSAVIGWVELQSREVLTVLREHAGDDTAPVVHVVTLGELERGVTVAVDESVRPQRSATLGFARDELNHLSIESNGPQPHLFGLVSTAVSRRVSHNDCWIAAGAIADDHLLVTQDDHLAEQLAQAAQGASDLAVWLDARERHLHVIHCQR